MEDVEASGLAGAKHKVRPRQVEPRACVASAHASYRPSTSRPSPGTLSLRAPLQVVVNSLVKLGRVQLHVARGGQGGTLYLLV